MYDVIFEALRQLNGGSVCKVSKVTGYKTDRILSIEEGKSPSDSLLLDIANYHNIPLSILKKFCRVDDINVEIGIGRLERCKIIRSLVNEYRNCERNKCNSGIEKVK